MCTVSFIQTGDHVIFTSNRDEHDLRPKALPPDYVLINGIQVCRPKDPVGGGTWVAMNQRGNVFILLNGVEEKHQRKSSYRRSRGLIVLEMASFSSPMEYWNNIDLNDIEPFSLITFENNDLYRLTWDEREKRMIALDAKNSYIWSSATLYPQDIRQRRQEWFDSFLDEYASKEISEADMLYFHLNTQIEDTENGLLINRKDQLKTQSVTQIIKTKDKIAMHYVDLHTNLRYEPVELVL